MMLTEREQFCAVLGAGPLLAADAIVVLCGEDAEPRMQTAVGLFMQRVAPLIVVTGGLEQPPGIQSAKTVHARLLGKGVAPDRIIVEPNAMHTRAQAVNVVALAKEKGWRRLLIVASSYHTQRAFLTFVQALDEAGVADSIHIVSIPCAHSPWFRPPAGRDTERLALLTGEVGKVEEYRALGHVASYARGLEYLRHWEGR